MLVVNVPIEPIEHRYSQDWHKWFIAELNDRKLEFTTVMGVPVKDTVLKSHFLDPVQTNKFKAEQISQICSAVEEGFIPRDRRVVFLMHDGWFPVEQIAYMRDMLGCHDWRIVGLFHAGTYDPWDQLAQHKMYTYGEDLENAWFKIYDRIIVASQYHRDLLLRSRKVSSSKIVVIPWKVDVPKDLLNTPKQGWIVFPHRICPEKQPALFAPGTFKNPPGYPPVTTSSIGPEPWTKRRYYETIAKSKVCVSFSLQETFGIAMFESVLLGCIPLVPDRLAYRDFYPRCFRYQDKDEFEWMLNEACMKIGFHQDALQRLQEQILQRSESFFPTLFKEVELI